MKSMTCDVCSKGCKKNEGHILTTKEVVTSPGYWDWVFRNVGLMIGDPDFSDLETMLISGISDKVFQMAAYKSGWWICNKCMKQMSDIDPNIPRMLAEEYMETGITPFIVKVTPPCDDVDIATALEVAIHAYEEVNSMQFSVKFNKFAFLLELAKASHLNKPT
jgi:hypothetical protein